MFVWSCAAAFFSLSTIWVSVQWNVADNLKTQLLSNSRASKPVIDLAQQCGSFSILILNIGLFQIVPVSRMEYSPQESAPVIPFFSRQSRKPRRSISCHPAVHSPQQYQFYHARKILWCCLLYSSLAYSPALVLALSPSVSNFYLPKLLCAPKHPCWMAPSEFLMRNRCVITVANR